MGSQPVNADLAAELWNELAEVRTSFPPAEELIAKGGLHIGRDRAKFMRSRIAPLVRQLNSDEARTVLGEARRFAALGECFVYLHWVSQAVGAPSATFRNYADHYLTSAIFLLEDRAGDGPRGAAKGRVQVWQADIESLRSLLNMHLDIPVHLITETKYPEPSSPTAPSTPESSIEPASQDPDADSIEKAVAAPEALPPPKTNEADELGRSGAGRGLHRAGHPRLRHRRPTGGRRPRRAEYPPLGIAIGKYLLALIGAVIAGVVVAVAVLAAARMRSSLPGWSKVNLENIFWTGVCGFLAMQGHTNPEDGFKVLGVRRSDRQSKKNLFLTWAASVIVSVIGVMCVSAKPNSMKLVDSGLTGLATLMSEQFGRMVSDRSAAILSTTIICAVVGVVLGVAIGFAFRLILILLSKESQEEPEGRQIRFR